MACVDVYVVTVAVHVIVDPRRCANAYGVCVYVYDVYVVCMCVDVAVVRVALWVCVWLVTRVVRQRLVCRWCVLCMWHVVCMLFLMWCMVLVLLWLVLAC